MNLSGKTTVDFALSVNGQIPAPTLEFTEGDEAEITVTNQIPNQELSIHWHGILLPNEMDGVPYTTTPPIKTGSSFTFKFPLRQSGTYWYHSHTNVQEQKGVYGAFVIHKKNDDLHINKDIAAVVSDWSDEDANQILKNLRKDGDYYLYKKNTVRSWTGAISAGEFGNYLGNEWNRMGGMDLSDVGYDAFLINGKKELQLVEAKPGDRIRLRIVNASASTYFFAALANKPMHVIAADGIDVVPVNAKDILMGMAETYDVLFTIPDNKNYELRLTAQDGTGYASAWIGNPQGEKVFAPNKPKPDLYASMNHGDHMSHAMQNVANPFEMSEEHNHDEMDMSGHGDMDMSEHSHGSEHKSDEAIINTLTVDDLESPTPTTLPGDNTTMQQLNLVLDGNMERYIWYINGKTISQDMYIPVNTNDSIRFVFENRTMMHHPMHLHGHFFRVINQYGEKSPLKHTVDVPPHGRRIIEFYANEPGYWMLHCHNLYHLKTGMARVVKYLSFTPTPEIQELQKKDPHMHDHWYAYGRAEAASNQASLFGRLSQTWNEFSAKAEAQQDEDWTINAEVFYARWMDNYFRLMIGANYIDNETRGLLGFGYKLPLLLESKVFIDHKSKLRVDLEKKFQWSTYLFSQVEYVWRQDSDLDSELLISLMYSSRWDLSYGFKYTGRSFGVGLNYQF